MSEAFYWLAQQSDWLQVAFGVVLVGAIFIAPVIVRKGSDDAE